MALSLIALSREADALSAQTLAAKLYADCMPERSAEHLRNARVIHSKIGQMLAEMDKAETPAPAGSPDAWRG